MNEARLKTELHKVSQEIKVHGNIYNVYRKELDKYKEPTGKEIQVAQIKGLYHITKGYVTETAQDGTRTHLKGQPMLLCKHEETKDIQTGDYIRINQNVYKVIDKNNIQEYNIVTDISMELMLDGKN